MDRPPITQSVASGRAESRPEETAGTERAGLDQSLRPQHWRGLGRILGFFCLVVLLAFAVDALINVGLRRIKTSDFGVSNRIVTGDINAQIVISGSSRALVHYDPRIIQTATGQKTFNLGRNGSQTDLQLAVLKAYLNHNTKPRLVIHNLDLFSFQVSREIYDPAQYMPYLREESVYTTVRRIYPDAWKWKWLPLYGYVVEDMRFTWLVGVRALLGIQPGEDHFQGFVPRHLPWTGDFEKLRAAHPDGLVTVIQPAGIQQMTELAELCRQQGIKLLLVYAPEYSEMQTLERNRAEVFARFQEICDRFQVPLWDYSSSDLSRNRDNFYNSQHLNADGAAAFSKQLSQKLVESSLLR